MPDHPAPPAALEAAQQAGYGEPIARLLTNLARGEGKDAKVGDAQLQAVTNWITVLGELEVAEDVIVKAITHNATKKTSQERRQAKFVKWLSEKASGEADTKNQDPVPGAEAPGTQTDSQPAANGNGNGQLEAGRALAELRQAKTDHEYNDRTVTRIAALATGVGPKARVDWPKVPPETLTVLAELLRSAGSLGWKNDQLDQEVLKYHNSAQQTSAAGRFSAFANYLTDLAETRAMTQDNAVEVA
jgi:high-affinity Fe2+/Pb2+ permease